jgi:antirestriction protein ArdC
MSTPFKLLSEKTANKMVMDLKNGTSIFQMPNNSMNSALPFNIESGNRYPGSSALVLLMEKRDDPRWATFNQANRNHTAVLKGATGTFINFMTQYEYQKVFKDGEPVLKEMASSARKRSGSNSLKKWRPKFLTASNCVSWRNGKKSRCCFPPQNARS